MKSLDKLLNGGRAFTAEEANALGLSNERLRLLTNQKKIEKVDYGVYLPTNAYKDDLYSLQMKREFVYSHETALYLHDLSDRDPVKYVCTVKRGYNSHKLKEAGFEIFYIKKEHYSIDIVDVETAFGNIVKTYSMERTLCDILRSESRMDKEIVIDAFKMYSKRKDKDLNRLKELSQLFRTTQKTRAYLEILF